MNTRFRIHVILIKVEGDGEAEDTTILEEEELAGYRSDFESEEVARTVFDSFTGIATRTRKDSR